MNLIYVEEELKELELELSVQLKSIEQTYSELQVSQSEKLTKKREKSKKTRSIIEELLEIQAALRRIKKKTYGHCEACGSQIELNHLLVNPCTRFCLACKPKYD